jgi:hypothetical protein
MDAYGITRQLKQKKEKHIILPSSALKKENIYVYSQCEENFTSI